ncbi:unnamed protein product [Closterium sp. NIES-54]
MPRSCLQAIIQGISWSQHWSSSVNFEAFEGKPGASTSEDKYLSSLASGISSFYTMFSVPSFHAPSHACMHERFPPSPHEPFPLSWSGPQGTSPLEPFNNHLPKPSSKEYPGANIEAAVSTSKHLKSKPGASTSEDKYLSSLASGISSFYTMFSVPSFHAPSHACMHERFPPSPHEPFPLSWSALGSKAPHKSSSSTSTSLSRHSTIKRSNFQGRQDNVPHHSSPSTTISRSRFLTYKHPNTQGARGASLLKPFQQLLTPQDLQQLASHLKIRGPQVKSPLESFNCHSSLKIFNKSSVSAFKATKVFHLCRCLSGMIMRMFSCATSPQSPPLQETMSLLQNLLPMRGGCEEEGAGGVSDALVAAYLIAVHMDRETDRELKAFCLAFDQFGPTEEAMLSLLGGNCWETTVGCQHQPLACTSCCHFGGEMIPDWDPTTHSLAMLMLLEAAPVPPCLELLQFCM